MDIVCPTEYEPLRRLNPFVYQTYKIRWVVVLTLAFINATNAFLWVAYCPVANYFVEYYETNEFTLNMITLIFPLVTVLFGFLVILTMSKTGMRCKLLFSSTMNMLGGGLRALSSSEYISMPSKSRLALVIFGQIIASTAQPICLLSTTKLAFDWFPDNQRTTANTIASFGYAVGTFFGSALIPLFVTDVPSVRTLNWFTFSMTVLSFVLTLLFVRRSKPPTPPSFASELSIITPRNIPHPRLLSAQALSNFGRNIIQPFKLPGFWIVFMTFGLTVAYFTMLSALSQQILCAKGYSNQFAGFCASALVAAGVITSGPVALLVDRTGLMLEVVKISCSLSALGSVALSVAIWYPDQRILIGFIVIWLGVFGFSQYSLVLELVAEATFPLPEYVSSGLLIIGSQILSLIVIPLMQSAAPALKVGNYKTTCGNASTPQDYSIPHMMLCALLGVLGVLQLFLLELPYRRRNITKSIIIPITTESVVDERVN